MSDIKQTSPGFAAAAQPADPAAVIHTGSEGLVAGEISIPVADGSLPAYRSAPTGAGPHPVILVIQEIFGVHEHIRDVTRRLAKLGYLAIAPELYFRQGDPAKAPDIDTLRETIVSKVPDRQVLDDLDATLAWADANGGDAQRIGITGFCWGGRITWLYAARQPRIKAGVAWYGRLNGVASGLTPLHPIDVVGQLKAPVLGLYGGQDTGIPLEAVAHFRESLKEAHIPSEIHLYPEAPHAFYADYRPSYRPDAAADGWQRLQAWFARHGVAPA
ncbi:dienelactone hydrolase family protein [Uliginosibacterium sp. H1]|uniref:dienelactone hydrolase family protein n=1 Tax=Uliginosibacterium sp. H1 TaxID=3114757 RepID=UPI002E17C011|nr:dienelactone hydrolase family protein [Uliginosibacterium sp. H1]